MTEEVVVQDAAPQAEPTPEPVANPVEQEARDQGWVSKEEWVESGRDEGEWRPAKEFVERGELYKSIHQTKRELKQTQQALDALQRHHEMVYTKAYQEALNNLKLQKRQAIREGDLETLETVEEQMDQLREERVKEQQVLAEQRTQSGPPPELVEFQTRNPWYGMDKGMTDDADAAGFVFLKNGGDKTRLLEHVEKEMKKRYPEKFGVKRAAPSAVAAPSRAGRPAPKDADIELDDGEREAMRTFVRMGVMTEAQYKAELKKAKGRS